MKYPPFAVAGFDADLSKATVVDGVFRGDGIYPSLSAKKNAQYTCPADLKDVKYLRGSDRYLMVAGNSAYHSAGGHKFLTLYDVSGDTLIYEEFMDGAFYGVISGGTSSVTYGDGVINARASSPGMCRGAYACGRMFGVSSDDPFKLKWTGEGGSFDLSDGIYGAGFVYPDPALGEILDVTAYFGKIVAVRERGLSVMTVGGSPDGFSLSQSSVSTPKIFGGTAQTANTGIYFYTEDGLYVYSGGKARRAECNLRGDITSPTGSAFGGGKYFLCGQSKFLGRQCVFVLDDFTGAAQLADVPARKIVAGKDGVIGYGGEDIYDFGQFAPSRTFFSADFGTARKKCLTRITARADGPVTVKISDGSTVRTLEEVAGARKLVMDGVKFYFEVASEGVLRSFSASAEVIDGV